MEQFLGLPPDGSAHGPQIDHLIALVHWVMFALFAGWGVYFVAVLVRFRASKRNPANYHGVKSHLSTWIEGAVVVVEAILLVVFSMPIWAERVDAFPSESGSTVVRVVAEQFAWNVHYPGPDGVFGRTSLDLVGTDNPLGLDRSDAAAKDDIATINQLNLPAGRPVIIHLTSKDVIHSLNLTAYRVKQDAVPGLSIPVWFTPEKTSLAIREEMAADFSVAEAVGTTATVPLPAIEEIAVVDGGSRPGYILVADVLDREEETVLSAGDELGPDNMAILAEAGITTVRARRLARLDHLLTVRATAGPDGEEAVPAHETLTPDVVTALVNAGLSSVEARKRSLTDPWLVHEALSSPDGEAIAAPGDYLTEAVITLAAAAGRSAIRVAPATPTEIACAQLCGLGHYRMRGYIDVLTPGEYQAWHDEQQTALREQFGTPAESSGETADAAAESDGAAQ